ncbi:MAG TPA: CPBP family intramembrane glutamic endopeptidase [Caulobacteraceae bacterium]|jgi:membrane protease YdiL (CAAX protease family)|nr:CPBP family intramembrane glutamic endopeptidase [Caulobacteraceae bacterium]
MSPWAAAAGGAVGVAFLPIANRFWPASAATLGAPPGRAVMARDFLFGLAAGLGAMAVIEFGAVFLDAARLSAGHSPPTIGAAIGWAISVVLIAAAQEGWVRGWLLARAWPRFGFRRAAIGSSGLFVLLHAQPGVLVAPPGVVVLGAAGLFLFGLAAAASVRATGSIAWAFGAHASWDYVGGFLLGAPAYGRAPGPGSLMLVTPHGAWGWAAGGDFGPEASLLALLVLAAAAWGWLRIQPRPGASH